MDPVCLVAWEELHLKSLPQQCAALRCVPEKWGAQLGSRLLLMMQVLAVHPRPGQRCRPGMCLELLQAPVRCLSLGQQAPSPSVDCLLAAHRLQLVQRVSKNTYSQWKLSDTL